MPKKLIAKDTAVLDTPPTLVVAPAASAAMTFTALAHVAVQLRALRDQAAAQFVARAEMAEAVAVALAANEHVFVYGPPGTAKSSLLRTFASGSGGKFFRIVLNPDITREDVVGPLDPAAVRNGEWRRKWSKFATSEIAFLDEIWKASPQVANMLLDGLEERLVTDGDDDLPIPLISAVAASNEVPDDKALRAAYDRFQVRLSLDYIHDPDDFRAMLTSVGAAPVAPLLTADDLRTIGKVAELMALNPPPEVTEQLVELWRQIGVGRISDRRWKKTLKLAMAYALLCDEPPAPRHLGVARWTLWSEPDEETSIRNTVLALTDPAASDVLDCEALLADLKLKAGTLQGAKLQERAEIAGKARKLVAKSQKLAASPEAKAYTPRLTAVANEATAIVNQVVDLMTGGGA